MNYEDYRNAFTIVNESDGQPYTGAKGEYPFVVYNDEFMEKINETGMEFPQHMNALLKMVNEEFSKTGYKLEGDGGMVAGPRQFPKTRNPFWDNPPQPYNDDIIW